MAHILKMTGEGRGIVRSGTTRYTVKARSLSKGRGKRSLAWEALMGCTVRTFRTLPAMLNAIDEYDLQRRRGLV